MYHLSKYKIILLQSNLINLYLEVIRNKNKLIKKFNNSLKYDYNN